MRRSIPILLALCALAFVAPSALAVNATRLKDMGSIDGVRKNQLIGYGLVVGLNGTGDGAGTTFTTQSTANFLERLGVSVPAGSISVKNVAAVIVTADMPAFASPGQKLDVLISSLGDAKSLHGGTLLMTPLRAPNGETYAVAQGAVSVGGYTATGGGGTTVKNHPTAGRIPGGGVFEREAPVPTFENGYMDYILWQPDYTTAMRAAEALNARFGEGVAFAVDAGRIRIHLPEVAKSRMVQFFSEVEAVAVEPDQVARVIIDEKTGTVVVGKDVRVLPVAISHGALTIKIAPYLEVSQPPPFSGPGAETVAREGADITASEKEVKVYLMNAGENLSTLVDALNALGVSPRELVTIFQALKTGGALEADLVLM